MTQVAAACALREHAVATHISIAPEQTPVCGSLYCSGRVASVGAVPMQARRAGGLPHAPPTRLPACVCLTHATRGQHTLYRYLFLVSSFAQASKLAILPRMCAEGEGACRFLRECLPHGRHEGVLA